MRQQIYLMLDKKENQEPIAVIFYDCVVLYQRTSYQKLQNSVVNQFPPWKGRATSVLAQWPLSVIEINWVSIHVTSRISNYIRLKLSREFSSPENLLPTCSIVLKFCSFRGIDTVAFFQFSKLLGIWNVCYKAVSFRKILVNSPPPAQNVHHFIDDIFRSISVNETFYILIQNFTEVCS